MHILFLSILLLLFPPPPHTSGSKHCGRGAGRGRTEILAVQHPPLGRLACSSFNAADRKFNVTNFATAAFAIIHL